VVNAKLIPVAARVPPELAEAVARLADAGDRSVSGEIRRAIREYVERADAGGCPEER
jgi:predicted transcriptional regulator